MVSRVRISVCSVWCLLVYRVCWLCMVLSVFCFCFLVNIMILFSIKIKKCSSLFYKAWKRYLAELSGNRSTPCSFKTLESVSAIMFEPSAISKNIWAFNKRRECHFYFTGTWTMQYKISFLTVFKLLISTNLRCSSSLGYKTDKLNQIIKN